LLVNKLNLEYKKILNNLKLEQYYFINKYKNINMLFKIVMILLAILAQITIQEAGNNVHKRIRMDIAHRNLTADLAWKSDATVISPV